MAGVNYKMVFGTEMGDYEVIVFCQPWTEIYDVLEVRALEETL